MSMNEMQKNFAARAVAGLSALRQKSGGDFDQGLRREAFRTIHTIKGTAQTFGMSSAAKLAGELEGLLASGSAAESEDLKAALFEGIGQLAALLEEGDSALPDWPPTAICEAVKAARVAIFLTRLPPAVFRRFSAAERQIFFEAMRRQDAVFCAEASFAAADFAEKYRALRDRLSAAGEIIAAMPAPGPAGAIVFQTYLASSLPAEALGAFIGDVRIRIDSFASQNGSAPVLSEMLRQAAAHFTGVTGRLDKRVRLTILAGETELSPLAAQRVFDILLHLIRNAVDHAFTETGEIAVELWAECGFLHLTFRDDGSGIDAEKIAARALEKGLIAGLDALTGQEKLELIFAPELSTAPSVSEISGRGVGLDAVRCAVEETGGKIQVKSRKGSGTTFEISLPLEEL